jgi:hypothetical protein
MRQRKADLLGRYVTELLRNVISVYTRIFLDDPEGALNDAVFFDAGHAVS